MEYIIYNITRYYFHITSYCLSFLKPENENYSTSEPNQTYWFGFYFPLAKIEHKIRP